MTDLSFKKEQVGTEVFYGTEDECRNYKRRMLEYNRDNPNFHGFITTIYDKYNVKVYLYDPYYTQDCFEFIG